MKPQNKALPAVIYSAFMAEYDTLSDENKTLIKNWLTELKLVGISNYFTNECQAILVKQIAENQLLRTFLLNHTERVHVLSLFAEEVDQDWFNQVMETVTKFRLQLSLNCVLPEAASESLYIPTSELRTLINNNPWILDLYLMLITDGVFDHMEEVQNKSA